MHIKKILLSAALVGIGFAASQTASAQLQAPPGTVDTCHLIATKVLVYPLFDPDGGGTQATSQGTGLGTANFQTVGNSPPGQVPKSTALLPVGVSTTVVSPELGQITITLDLTRAQPITSAQSNQASSDFPASVNIFFLANATVQGLPGLYVNDIPLHLTANNILQLHPLRGTLHLAAPVTFRRIDNPNITFTLNDVSLQL